MSLQLDFTVSSDCPSSGQRESHESPSQAFFPKKKGYHPVLSASITPRDAAVSAGRGGSALRVSSTTLQDNNCDGDYLGAEPYASSVEARRCHVCGGSMTSTRYQRLWLRFLDVFDCRHCNARFKQESRGFQGFYLGCMLSLMAPPLWACFGTNKVPEQSHLFIALFFFLTCMPVFKNLLQYFETPVIQRGSPRILSSEESSRGHFMRTLGGSVMSAGFCYGVAIISSVYIIVAAATMITGFLL